MRQFWPLAVIIVIGLLVALFGMQREPIPASNDSNPQRIITIAPSITEMAFAIGLGDKIVGVSDYCDYPNDTENLPKIGGFINPNIEAIVNLKPDLVIVYSNSGKLQARLDSLQIPNLAVSSNNLDDIKQSIAKIGDATGHQSQAKRVINDFEHQLNRVSNKVSASDKPSVLIVMGHSKESSQGSTIFVAGHYDFYNDLIELVGGINAFSNTALKTGTLSAEGILTTNPDVIIDLFPEADDHNYDLGKVKQNWQSLVQVNAVQNNRVHIVEENYATIPGPRLGLLLEQMAELIHPELEWQTP
jgi:iron complex transport system substrate-binding protein